MPNFIDTNKRDITEELKASGLWFLIKIFRLWSFRLDAPPSTRWLVNRFYVGFVYFVLVLNLAHLLTTFPENVYDATGGVKSDILCLYTVMGVCYITNALHFTFAVTTVKRYRLLFLSFSTSVRSITDRKSRTRCVRGVKIITVLCLLPLVLSYCMVISSLLDPKFCTLKYKEMTERMIRDQLANLSLLLWANTAGTFYVFTNCCLGLACYLLCSLMTYHLEKQTGGEEDLWEREVPRECPVKKMIVLQKMSSLIEETDRVFSRFLLLSMCFEFIVCVAIMKVMALHNYFFSSLVNLVQIFMFIFKAYVCGHVNSKFESYLRRNVSTDTPKDLTRCSAEEINFHFYLNEQLMNRAQLTYGGLFAVKKTFIFTIAGTVITYALLIQDTP